MNSETEIAIRYPSHAIETFLDFSGFFQRVTQGSKINKGQIIGEFRTRLGNVELLSPASGLITYIHGGNWHGGQLICRIQTNEWLKDSDSVADDIFQKVLSKCEHHHASNGKSVESAKKETNEIKIIVAAYWIIYILLIAWTNNLKVFGWGLVVIIILTLMSRGLYLHAVENRKKAEAEVRRYPGKNAIMESYRQAVSIHSHA